MSLRDKVAETAFRISGSLATWEDDADAILADLRAQGVIVFESREALERAVQAALDGPWMTWSPEHGDFPSLDPWGDGCVTASAIVARMLAGSEG